MDELEAEQLTNTDEAIELDATAHFTAVTDAPDFTVMPLKQGEMVSISVAVHYSLEDGLIKHIKVSRRGSSTRS